MKPNQQQEQWLREYLRSILTYRETYEEVYDHILVALETQPGQQFFETSVNKIVEEDFGGSNGLMNLEENSKIGVLKDSVKQYWRFFTECLTYPFVIYIVIAFIVIIYTTAHINPSKVAIAFILILVSPAFVLAYRGLKIGLRSGDTKMALRDSIFRRLFYRFFYYLLVADVLLSVMKTFFGIRYHINPVIIRGVNYHPLFTITFILVTLHAMAIYKLYKDEFKMNILKR